MITRHCEREPQVLAAVHVGEMNPDLQTHARECPACSEVFALVTLLKEASVISAREYAVLPPADFLWQKAKERARRMAVTKALIPIRFMTALAILGFACLPLLGALSRFVRQCIATWSGYLDTTYFALPVSLSAFSGPAVLLGCSGMLLFLTLTSWFVLRTE